MQRRRFEDASHARNTKRGYAGDWATFVAWCNACGVASLPASPDTIARYITERAGQGRKVATIRRNLSAIAMAHRAMRIDVSPTEDIAVKRALRGIERVKGTAQTHKAAAVVPVLLQLVAATPGVELRALRDRALLLFGFASALRRSELSALRVEDLVHDARGVTVTIPRSKTDQTGRGRQVGVPRSDAEAPCPVRALGEWLVAARIERGPVFRPITRHGDVLERPLSTDAISDLIKAAARRAGLDAASFAGHSLRRGLATSAARDRKSIASIQRQLGHASPAMSLRYIEEAELLSDDNAASGLL